MRWWLALAFAAIAATTAVVVSEIYTHRAESAFRSRAQELVVGSAVAAAQDIAADPRGALATAVSGTSAVRKLGLFVVDRDGRLLSPATSHGIAVGSIARFGEVVSTVTRGRRYVESRDGGKVIVVGLFLRRADGQVLVAVGLRPEVVAEVGILRNEVVPSTLLAILAGAAAGLVVALLIGARLRLIARAATRIAAGDFDGPVRSAFPDELGELARSVDSMRTSLRDSFEQLAAERDRFGLLLSQLEEGVVAVDEGLRVVFANDSAVAALGAGPLEREVLPAEWAGVPLRSLAQQLLRPGAEIVYSRAVADPDHTYAVTGIPSVGTPPLVAIVIRDISDSERRERAEREFVANAAHELRTPIQSIGNAVEVLLSDGDLAGEERQRFLAIVERQSRRLGKLVHALLVLARAQTRQEALNLEPVELRPLLLDIAADLRVRDGVDVRVDCPGDTVVLGKPEFVEQIVSNLAVNAARHVEEGAIVLRGLSLEASQVAIEISDTGPGMSASVQERVFDRFFSGTGSSRESYGLGLAIVREVARALGGVVDIESVPGRGTTVRVTLAAAPAGVEVLAR